MLLHKDSLAELGAEPTVSFDCKWYLVAVYHCDVLGDAQDIYFKL